jgi:hypothetical protein
MTHEADLYDEILLELSGPDVRIWRQRVVRYGFPGLPDLTGFMRGGLRLDVEVKRDQASARKRSATREAQERYRDTARRFGVVYLDAVESRAHARQLLQEELCKKR